MLVFLLIFFIAGFSSLASPSPPGGEHWRDVQEWSHDASSSSSAASQPVDPAVWLSGTSVPPLHPYEAYFSAQHAPWTMVFPTYDVSSGSSHQQAHESHDYASVSDGLRNPEQQNESSGLDIPQGDRGDHLQIHGQRLPSHPDHWLERSHENFFTHATMAPHAGGQSMQSLDLALRGSQEYDRQQQQKALEQLQQLQTQYQQQQQHQQQWTQASVYGGNTPTFDLPMSDSAPNLDYGVEHLLPLMQRQQLSSPSPSPQQQHEDQGAEDEGEERRNVAAEGLRRKRDKRRKLKARYTAKMAIDPERAEWLKAREARWEWKAHLKRGSLKPAYDKYYKHTRMKEVTARKHIDFVQNLRLVEELMSADEDTSRKAALTIFEMNNVLNHTHTISEAKRLLCKAYYQVVSDFTAVVGKSYTTTVRRLEETLTPDLARLLKEPETYQEGFQGLTQAYEEEARKRHRPPQEEETRQASV